MTTSGNYMVDAWREEEEYRRRESLRDARDEWKERESEDKRVKKENA